MSLLSPVLYYTKGGLAGKLGQSVVGMSLESSVGVRFFTLPHSVPGAK